MNAAELVRRYAPNEIELIEQITFLAKDEPEETRWYVYSLLVEELVRRYSPDEVELIEKFATMAQERSQEAEWLAYSFLVEKFLPSFEFDVITVDAQGEEINRRRGKAHYFTEDLGDGVGLEMVYIPGGEAVIGEEEEKIDETDPANWRQESEASPGSMLCAYPSAKVKIKPFFLSKYPVTNLQWNTIATEPFINQELELKTNRNYQGDNFPVTLRNQYDPIEFCERLSKKIGISYRLPNDAEWEYACRAGTTSLSTLK